jgi:hypothetical protein
MALRGKWIMLFAVYCIFCYSVPALGEVTQHPYQDTQWEELVPKSWRPEKAFEGLDIDNLPDGDPRVEKAYEAFMAEWTKAPANNEMNGKRIKIPGFVAPLDWENDAALKEFLLVPYFGACIHMPPPPANQIIYVKMDKPFKGINSMDAIWAYGTIFVEKNDSGDMGASSYSIKIDKMEPYKK